MQHAVAVTVTLAATRHHELRLPPCRQRSYTGGGSRTFRDGEAIPTGGTVPTGKAWSMAASSQCVKGVGAERRTEENWVGTREGRPSEDSLTKDCGPNTHSSLSVAETICPSSC